MKVIEKYQFKIFTLELKQKKNLVDNKLNKNRCYVI